MILGVIAPIVSDLLVMTKTSIRVMEGLTDRIKWLLDLLYFSTMQVVLEHIACNYIIMTRFTYDY